eukprot:COSAG02_NODE_8481_length_2554_cov_7.631738_2_plen_535_part_00
MRECGDRAKQPRSHSQVDQPQARPGGHTKHSQYRMAAAAAMAGVHGLEPWLRTLRVKLAAEPEPRDVPTALAPLAAFGIDVDAVLLAVSIHQSAPEADWHPDDWRRSHPEFPPQYALVIYVYTMQDPRVYAALGAALHAADRDSGPGGVSPRLRAFLPLTKLLDVALVAAARVWGPFVGQVFRGVKYAFPEPTVALHDPVGYFPSGQPGGPPARELNWFEFNSSSTRFDVMYRPWFCGKSGPRTVFTIQSVEGVSVKPFSAVPDEEEVLFRPLARFRVTGSVKKLTPADLGPNPPENGGFPDDVMLQQLPSLQEGEPPTAAALADLEPEPEPEPELDHEAAALARTRFTAFDAKFIRLSENGRVAEKYTSERGNAGAMCAEWILDGVSYAEFTVLASQKNHIMVGLSRPTASTVGLTKHHWGVLGWDEGKFCHVEGDKKCNPGAFGFGDPSAHSTPWHDKKEQPFGQNDTIGLQFDTATGRLTVYKKSPGTALVKVGVASEELPGYTRGEAVCFAVGLRNKGDKVRVARKEPRG